MRYLTLKETLELHHRLLEQSGGLAGIRDLGALESALAQPLMTFGGEELYPTIIEKASALGFSLIKTIPSLTAINGSATRPWKLFLF
jgi:death-on-curing protein